MRRPSCGWALALAVAQQRLLCLCHGHADGDRSVSVFARTASPPPPQPPQRRRQQPQQQLRRRRRQATRNRGDSLAFAVPAAPFLAAPAAASAAACDSRGGRAGVAPMAAARNGPLFWGPSDRRCGGVSRLEAKKSKVKAEEAEFRCVGWL